MRVSRRGCAGLGVRADGEVATRARRHAAQRGSRTAPRREQVAHLHSAACHGRVEDQPRAALRGDKARLQLLLAVLADLVKVRVRVRVRVGVGVGIRVRVRVRVKVRVRVTLTLTNFISPCWLTSWSFFCHPAMLTTCGSAMVPPKVSSKLKHVPADGALP